MSLPIMIPNTHPRYRSLEIREKLVKAYQENILALEGLIAHGRGEVFDYLIGEKTERFAIQAEMAAVAELKTAKNPVLSVNGNVAALVAQEYIEFARSISAKIEVNLFYRTEERTRKIYNLFKSHGFEILGLNPDSRLPGLDHYRALCTNEGIYSADVVMVPLEDGDRTIALKNMNKKVIAIDLNPLSRTAQTADITIVNELTRTIPEMISFSNTLTELEKIKKEYNNRETLKEALKFIKTRLESLATSP